MFMPPLPPIQPLPQGWTSSTNIDVHSLLAKAFVHFMKGYLTCTPKIKREIKKRLDQIELTKFGDPISPKDTQLVNEIFVLFFYRDT